MRQQQQKNREFPFYIALVYFVVKIANAQQLVAAEIPDTAPAYCYREVTQRPCRANLRRYSYDVSLNECVEFTFGGCSMSLNIFMSRDECEKRCKRNQTLARQLPETEVNCRFVLNPAPEQKCLSTSTQLTRMLLQQRNDESLLCRRNTGADACESDGCCWMESLNFCYLNTNGSSSSSNGSSASCKIMYKSKSLVFGKFIFSSSQPIPADVGWTGRLHFDTTIRGSFCVLGGSNGGAEALVQTSSMTSSPRNSFLMRSHNTSSSSVFPGIGNSVVVHFLGNLNRNLNSEDGCASVDRPP